MQLHTVIAVIENLRCLYQFVRFTRAGSGRPTDARPGQPGRYLSRNVGLMEACFVENFHGCQCWTLAGAKGFNDKWQRYRREYRAMRL